MVNFFKENTKKTVKNKEKQKLTVKVEKLDTNGCGVAYYKDKPIFINGSLPNEVVDVQLVEQKNKYSRGKLLSINNTSEKRVAVKCQHFNLCGGCDIQHVAYEEQLNFKQNKIIELFSRSGMSLNVVKTLPWQKPITSLTWHYRRKARIGVQFDKNANATIGFRQKATNQLVAVKSCPVLVQPVDVIFPRLKKLIAKLSVKKSIGHIEVICADNDTNDAAKVTLVVRQIRAINAQDRALWETFAKDNQCQVYFQENDTDDIESDSDDSMSLHYQLMDGIQINFSTTDFIQINEQVNLTMVEQSLAWLTPTPDDQILDLFCGLGNFSLPLAKKSAAVVGVEGVQSMVDKAMANARFNHIDNCRFYQADLNNNWLSNEWAKQRFTQVLLDPARAGAEFAITQVIKLDIPKVLYVSCEPTTLANDSQLLLLAGYKIEKIGLIDMFSHTKHVETMVLFSK